MSQPDRPQMSRRRLLASGGAAGALGLAGAGGFLAGRRPGQAPGSDTHPATAGDTGGLVPFYGAHQAGVQTAQQHNAAFAAFTLSKPTDREAAGRMMRLVTDDAARLTQARPALNDQEPELADRPARLSITFGFGGSFFDKLQLAKTRPAGLVELPAYDIDRLDPQFGGGDLLVQVCADDQLVLSHALRQVTKTLRAFAKPAWTQLGFVDGSAIGAGRRPRNLMGQIDGTENPVADSADFSNVVFSSGSPPWFAGGTTLVLRRIAMILNTWDELDRPAKELAVGRRLSDGAPLTGKQEFDRLDLSARDNSGLPVIPPFAHTARAHPRNGIDRFLRRPYNYLLPTPSRIPDSKEASDSGLLFAAYQADIRTQYLPVQARLAEQDLLNTWTVPIGSATFALPPGCAPGGFIGEGILT